MTRSPELPQGVCVIERNWLSSNNILCIGSRAATLVDSGYCTQAEQTVALVDAALAGRPLDQLVNTHLHSDHCGGNAGLQNRYPRLQTFIPPGMAPAVSNWDPQALGYVPTGQLCPPFKLDGLVVPGTEFELADLPWQVHAAPGHDPDSVILFEPRSRTLISADALWENGFGVVFPELEGEAAFDLVAATFDLIEQLDPCWIVPGHGRVFHHGPLVISQARRRLDAFVSSPHRHGRHAAKVLLKFKLLDSRQMPLAELIRWAMATTHFRRIHRSFAAEIPMADWVDQLTQELVRSGAARMAGESIHDD
ncbi:MBL fold metallo-hydrolase [Piscinibacter sakaiensis]|uniref:MBL fold metallo-hydrolase n=1 Tax=Piscinibacter sakaiensis TaxID=1547922 RepID=UPI003AAC1875